MGKSKTTLATPEQVKQMFAQVRLYSILFEEVHFWIMGWNIEVAEEDALCCAKQAIIPHIFRIAGLHLLIPILEFGAKQAR